MAKDPFQQLHIIKKASQKGKPITDCFRLLYKRELLVRASANINSPVKSHSPPIKNRFAEIDELIGKLRNGAFHFNFLNKQEKGNQQELPFEDLLVLEAVHLILESIYEPLFSQPGCFREKESPYQALLTIKKSFGQMTWCIKGEFVHSICNAQVLLKLISRKIRDKRFLYLIKTALSSGLLDNKQTSSLRILLENINFLEVDQFIKKQFEEYFDKKEPYGAFFQAIQYVRFGSEFVIGISSTRKSALFILEKLKVFFNEQLRVNFKHRQIFLSHLENPIPFLGYEFFKQNRHKWKRHKGKNYDRKATEKLFIENHSFSGKISLQIPARKINEFARKNGYGNLENGKISHRRNLLQKSEQEILAIYNNELRRFAEYYRLVDNFHHLDKLLYLAEGSFIKTIAAKRKSTSAKTARSMRTHKQGVLSLPGKDHNSGDERYQFMKLANLSKEIKGCSIF